MKHLADLCLSVGMALVAATAIAQVPPVPDQPLASRQVLPVWPGKPPGTHNEALKESVMAVPNTNLHLVRNVTEPTLTVFLPKSGNPANAAVIIAPGGGFRVLAID
jgi:hypothetical protein